MSGESPLLDITSWLPCSFPFLIGLMWVWHCYVSSVFWNAIAREYPAGEEPDGPEYFPVTLTDALVWERGHNTIAKITDDGLYLVLPELLRMFHKPIQVPWNALQVVEAPPNKIKTALKPLLGEAHSAKSLYLLFSTSDGKLHELKPFHDWVTQLMVDKVSAYHAASE